jgi:hypothetical protein
MAARIKSAMPKDEPVNTAGFTFWLRIFVDPEIPDG